MERLTYVEKAMQYTPPPKERRRRKLSLLLLPPQLPLPKLRRNPKPRKLTMRRRTISFQLNPRLRILLMTSQNPRFNLEDLETCLF